MLLFCFAQICDRSNRLQNCKITRAHHQEQQRMSCFHFYLQILFTVSYCPQLNNPDHGTVDTNGLTLNSKASYSCKKGYQLMGTKFRYCQLYQDRSTYLQRFQWTDVDPFCQGTSRHSFYIYIYVRALYGMSYMMK